MAPSAATPEHGCGPARGTGGLSTWLALLAALWVLNTALSFHNVWPTPWVTTRHEISVEAALLVCTLAVLAELRGAASRRMLRIIAVVLTVLCIGRYAEVTAPALYGRRINLYWDAAHLPQVAAMLARATPVWVTAAVVAGLVAIPVSIYATMRLALSALERALAHAWPRRTAASASAVLITLFAVARLTGAGPDALAFSLPVTATYAQQAAMLYAAVRGTPARAEIARHPLPEGDLARLDGADVVVIFIESYGATAFDDPRQSQALQPARAALARALARGARAAVSAFVVSPTFGGASWLAHSSLLAGHPVTDGERYAALLTSSRDTLVQRFARRGYRTVAMMPGLKQAWPEGSFYRFAHIYGEPELGYTGPAFGWWRIPDQFALAKLDALEIAPKPRAPLFAVFPTVSTHLPFRPTPPYQPDWTRVLGAEPFDPDAVSASLATGPDWNDLSPAYADALGYSLTTLAGYLQRRPAHEQVLIVLGDHQPAASVSGAGASHEVPVHVFAHRPALLRGLIEAGFEPGLTPRRRALMPMHELAPVLLRAFSTGPDTADARQ